MVNRWERQLFWFWRKFGRVDLMFVKLIFRWGTDTRFQISSLTPLDPNCVGSSPQSVAHFWVNGLWR